MMTEALLYHHFPASSSINTFHQFPSVSDTSFSQSDSLYSLTTVSSTDGSISPVEKCEFTIDPLADPEANYLTLSPQAKHMPLRKPNDSNNNETIKPEILKPLLPPCRVCGMKASGLHYGVNSCEACKGFFRRSLLNNGKYACTRGGVIECKIVPGRRSSCSYCRYQKCLRLGMSINAIRTGRYTHQKKANDITEVKNLQKTQKEIEQKERLDKLTEILHEGVKSTQLIQLLTTHHKDMIPRPKIASIKETELLNEAFGFQSLSQEVHLSFFTSTGVDLDNRKEAIENWSSSSKNRLMNIIALARSIPGFSSITVDDQVKLLKASRCEAISGMVYNHFDSENQVFYSACTEQIISAAEFFTIYDDQDFVDLLFSNAVYMQKLNLTVSELLIWMAVIITFPDRADLMDRVGVEKINEELLEALTYSLAINHPDRPRLLAQVLMSFTKMRELTVRSDKALSKIQQFWSTKCQLDPFWGEFIADSEVWCREHF